MSVIPTGLPAWSRTAAHDTYGGHLQKQNYLLKGVVNPQTDVSAEEFVRLCEDLAAVVRTSPYAIISFICNDTSPAAPTIYRVNMMTRKSTANYAGNAAPAGFPSAARNGNGDVTFTFPTTDADAYGVSHPVDIQHAVGSVWHGTAGTPTFELLDTNADGYIEVVRIRLFTYAGAANTDGRASVVFWT